MRKQPTYKSLTPLRAVTLLRALDKAMNMLPAGAAYRAVDEISGALADHIRAAVVKARRRKRKG